MNEEILRCYRLLEVLPGASSSQLRQAYMDLVKVWHPDRFGNDAELQQKAQEKLKAINLAYEQLCSLKSAESEPERKSESPKSICVDRFVYCGRFCDETTASSLLPDSVVGRGQMNLPYFNIISTWAPKFRRVEYILEQGAGINNVSTCVSHTNLELRTITLNKSIRVTQKALITPLAIIFIRDNLSGILPHTEPIRRALACAGWRGESLFDSDKYLQQRLS